jgi:predicted Rossmann fold flavoprotein
MKELDVLIIGAGAAGLMCGIEAGKRGHQVLILDHSNKVGKKILMSGGGRCNFTNYHITPHQYISHNPHFCKSALSRYTQWDFIELVKRHRIPFHEKALGQLFCDNKAKDIVEMLLRECESAGVAIQLNTNIDHVSKKDKGYQVNTDGGNFFSQALIIATGGLSIPTMGASPFAYKIAQQFGIRVWPTRAGLVPFTFDVAEKERFSSLSGIGVDCVATSNGTQFREHVLFTHRGLSGPAILQISSYWHSGGKVSINLLPEKNLLDSLKSARKIAAQKQLFTILSQEFPKRMVEVFVASELLDKKMSDFSNAELQNIADQFHTWNIQPNGTEGYRTAEVTLGGVDCNAFSSKTMEATQFPGLYFIGEALDVTGWLGGFNFQWAWSSGWAAGQSV